MPWQSTAASSRTLALCLGLAAILCAGCSDRARAPLSGTVTLDGLPLKAGMVVVHGEGGRVTSTSIEADGKYRIPDAPVGKVKLAVITLPAGQAVLPPDTKAVAVKPPVGLEYVAIPSRYHEVSTSGQATTVEAGQENRFDIRLKK